MLNYGLQQQDSRVQSRLSQATALVSVYRARGGVGWSGMVPQLTSTP